MLTTHYCIVLQLVINYFYQHRIKITDNESWLNVNIRSYADSVIHYLGMIKINGDQTCDNYHKLDGDQHMQIESALNSACCDYEYILPTQRCTSLYADIVRSNPEGITQV